MRYTIVLLLAVAILRTYDEAAQGHGPSIGKAILQIDSNDISPHETIDVDDRARVGGLERSAEDFWRSAHKADLIQVLDSHLLRLRTIRGEETVALIGVRGETPIAPEPLNTYIRQTAIPCISTYLRSAQGIVVDGWLLRGDGGDYYDPEGHRAVQVRVLDGDGNWTYLATEIIRRGWGFAAPTFFPDDQLSSATILDGVYDRSEVGLRALDEWEQLRKPLEASWSEIASLSNDHITARAISLQNRLAPMLGWTPETDIQVQWVDIGFIEKTLRGCNQDPCSDAAAEGDVSDSSAILESASSFADLIAWYSQGSSIYIVRRFRGAIAQLDGLDRVLTHELVHQYQAEALGIHTRLDDEGDRLFEMLSGELEGHAEYISMTFISGRNKDAIPVAHELESISFRDMVNATLLDPDEILERYACRDYTGLSYRKLLAKPKIVEPQPTIKLLVEDDRQVLSISNSGQCSLAGLYSGRWFVMQPSSDLKAVAGIAASPPFHLVLHPGDSIKILLTDELPVNLIEEPVIRGMWSPTPRL